QRSGQRRLLVDREHHTTVLGASYRRPPWGANRRYAVGMPEHHPVRRSCGSGAGTDNCGLSWLTAAPVTGTRLDFERATPLLPTTAVGPRPGQVIRGADRHGSAFADCRFEDPPYS